MKLIDLINNRCDFAYRVDWPPGEVLRINVPSSLIFYRDDNPALDITLKPEDITADDWKCGEHVAAKAERKRRDAERKQIWLAIDKLSGREPRIQ